MEYCEHMDNTNWTFRYGEGEFPPGTDSYLLSDFPRLRRGAAVCDLGCGAGFLELLLLRREPTLRLTGVEIREGGCRFARRNVAENGLEDRISIVNADLCQPEQLPPAGSFDLVVSNPPYFDTARGVASPDSARRLVREEANCTLRDVCAAAARLLRWGGSFCMVHKTDRLTDLCCTMREAGVEPKRLQLVQKQPGKAPELVLIEGRRGGKPGMAVEPPLLLASSSGADSAQNTGIYFQHTEEYK